MKLCNVHKLLKNVMFCEDQIPIAIHTVLLLNLAMKVKAMKGPEL